MKPSALDKFNELREKLLEETKTLEARLAEINAALGAPSASYIDNGRAQRAASTPLGARGARRKNPAFLKDLVLAATESKPLTRHEILEAVQRAGYRFRGKVPLNSLNTFLYTCKDIKKIGDSFGPA